MSNTRMDKVLKAWLKMYPNGTKAEFKKYYEALSVCLDVRGK